MKKYLGLGVLALMSVLAACGGGSGGLTPRAPHPVVTPTPIATATATPPGTHAIAWTIVQAGQSVHVGADSGSRRSPQSVVAISQAQGAMANECDPSGPWTDGSGGCVQNSWNNPAVSPVEVTPSPDPGTTPSPEPTPQSITTTMAGASFSILSDGTYSNSAGYGDISSPTWALSTPTVPGAYTITATYPDGSQGSIPLSVYANFTISCGNAGDYAGYDFEDGVPTNDVTHADVYFTGPECSGAFNGAFGLNFPYGATAIQPDSFLPDLKIADYQAQFTNTTTVQEDGLTELLMFKTSNGSIVKCFVYSSSTIYNLPYQLSCMYAVADPPDDFTY